MLRSRRSTLAVPGGNRRFLEKAQGLPAGEVFLDLEDAVAPAAKGRTAGMTRTKTFEPPER